MERFVATQSIGYNITIELMFAGINMFMPKNINCITIIISLKGNIRHKNIKIDCKQSNSRLSVSCIYFVVLLTTNCLFKKQKKTKIIFKIQKEE